MFTQVSSCFLVPLTPIKNANACMEGILFSTIFNMARKGIVTSMPGIPQIIAPTIRPRIIIKGLMRILLPTILGDRMLFSTK